jgi:hypothetical protein
MQLVPDHEDDAKAGGAGRLLTARDVGNYLRIAPKKVYSLPIPRIEISARRIRWLESDVFAYTKRRRVA